jgi:hypothetical protein
MKLVIGFVLCLLVTKSYCQQSLYGLSITAYNSNQHNMQEFKGKKIWIIILPATQTTGDSAFLNRIDSIGLAQKGLMTTIVVPSYEDGYPTGTSGSLTQWYHAALDTSIIISQPLYTHASSGASQSGLFSWLTHSAQNAHFDFEVNGPGTMFFIDEQGTLYSVFGTESKWSNRIINHALQ